MIKIVQWLNKFAHLKKQKGDNFFKKKNFQKIIN